MFGGYTATMNGNGPSYTGEVMSNNLKMHECFCTHAFVRFEPNLRCP
jgi:hypothetical protein